MVADMAVQSIQSIGIAGAGLVGRVVALNCVARGIRVHLFDLDKSDGDNAAGGVAAGMLAIFAELESATSSILTSGQRSIQLWPGLLGQIGVPEAFVKRGSIVTAHHADMPDLQHFITQLKSKVDLAGHIQTLNQTQLTALEPELSHHAKAYFFPEEGQVNAQVFMAQSQAYLQAHPLVTWSENTPVKQVGDGEIHTAGQTYLFDWVMDTRGLGAKVNFADLRGVRGEVFWLDAPNVGLTRPVRLMHPRYKIYIVPRPNGRYVVGATEIESEDRSPMSVRSSLELLSAAYSVHSGFGEARIVKMLTHCRPALPDNLPKIMHENRCTRINGLYRHGYLLAPAVVEQALQGILGKAS